MNWFSTRSVHTCTSEVLGVRVVDQGGRLAGRAGGRVAREHQVLVGADPVGVRRDLGQALPAS